MHGFAQSERNHMTATLKRTLIVSLMIALGLFGALLCNTVASSKSYAATSELTATSDDLVRFANKKTHTYPLLKSYTMFGQKANEYSVSFNDVATKVKSSNSKVVSVSYSEYVDEEGYAENVITFKLKKVGKAKITFTYKGKNRSTTINVQKYVNPLKSFKIGTKSFVKYLDSSKIGFMSGDSEFWLRSKAAESFWKAKPSGSKTIKLVAKKGWKVSKIEQFNVESMKTTKIKNGKKIKGLDRYILYVYMKNTKTGITYKYRLN